MKLKIYIPQDIDASGKNYLTERGYEIKPGTSHEEAVMMREIGDCDGMIVRTAKVSRAVMEAAPNLKVIGRHGAGTDTIDVRAATELGIRVTNGPYSNTESVAEHTAAFIMALAHRLVFLDKSVHEGDWDMRNRLEPRLMDVRHKTLGLVGFGKIASSVARKMALGMEMKILAFTRSRREDVPEYVEYAGSVEELFERSDVVSIHCPLTPGTRGMAGRELLAHLKPEALLVNTSRGEIIDEQALYEALRGGKLRAAALDVAYGEVMSPDNPLLSLPNVILSPHCASHTRESFINMALHAAIGVDEALSGKPVSWPVN